MTDKELDNLFKSSFEKHEMPVPADMWSRIRPEEEKRRRGIVWWMVPGVAALLVLLGTATWFYYSSPADTSSQPVATAALKNPAENKTSSATEINKADDTKTNVTENDSPVAKQTTSHSTTNNEVNTSSQHNSASVPENVTVSVNDETLAKNNDRHHFKKPSITESLVMKDAGNSSSEISTSANHEVVAEAGKPEDQQSTENREQAAVASNLTPQSGSPVTIQANDSAKQEVAVNVTTNESQATLVHIKKLKNERAASLEVMAAGYIGNSNLYDATATQPQSIVNMGPITPKLNTSIRGFSFNVRVDKPISKHFSLKTGLQFLQTYQTVSYKRDYLRESAVVNTIGIIRDTLRFAQINFENPEVKSVSSHVSIPLLLSYQTQGSRFRVGATAGVLMNIVSWYYGDVPNKDYSGVVSAKSSYKLNNGTSLYAGVTASRSFGNWQLFVEPHLQYNLSSSTKSSASFKQKITNYGLGIGIRKKIGK